MRCDRCHRTLLSCQCAEGPSHFDEIPDSFKASAIAALKACGATEQEIKDNWTMLAEKIHRDAVALLAGYRVMKATGKKPNPRDVDSDD